MVLDGAVGELEALGDEVELDTGLGESGLPSFMQDEVPNFIDEPPVPGKVKEAAG